MIKEVERVERVLAKPMVQGGVEHAAGETVLLRPDQVERLEADGYFAEPKSRRGGAK